MSYYVKSRTKDEIEADLVTYAVNGFHARAFALLASEAECMVGCRDLAKRCRQAETAARQNRNTSVTPRP